MGCAFLSENAERLCESTGFVDALAPFTIAILVS